MYNECVSPSSARSSTTRTTTTTTTTTPHHHPKLRSPICCLGANAVVEPESMISGSGPRTPRSPYEWLKSTAQEIEIRDRFRRVKSRIKVTCKNNNCGYNCVHHHNQSRQQNHHQSYPGDFSYDPLSYALNFEDDVRENDDGSFPSFTARLPSSPVVAKSRSATVDLISF